MKINPEIKTQWVAALRSGKYKQGYSRLRGPRSGTFCCLGVLCNLHAQAHPKIAAKETDPGYYMGHAYDAPNAVREWAGFEERCGPAVAIGFNVRALAGHNDDRKTFLQIADAIEAQL